MRTVLVEAMPWDPATGAAVPVRLAGCGRYPYTHKGAVDWLAGVVALPKVTTSLAFDDQGFGGGAVPQAAAIGFGPSQPGALERLARLVWTKAPITISTGDDEATPVAWTVSLAGTVAGYEISGGAIAFTLSDMATPLSKPLAPLTFAGTGGLEGGDEAKGRVKRRSFGRVFNVEGRVLDKAANVYEFGDPARPVASFAAVRDRGRAGPTTILAAQSTAAATLAALVAAAPPAGGAIVAPTIACAKWWTVPAGPLTADLVGEVVGTRGDSVPELAAAICDTLGGPAVLDLATAIAARPQPAGLHIGDGSETAAAALDRLLIGASLAWAIVPAGGVRLRALGFDAPVETIVADSVERERVLAPVTSVSVGYQQNERQHSDAEISAAVLAADVVLDDGTSIATMLAAIVSDGVLSRAEKPQVVIDRLALLADRDALQARYVALGTPAAIKDPRGAAFAKLDALDTYLGGLKPTWSDVSVDTPIVAADYRAAWNDAYAAVAAFTAAITGQKGDPGTPGSNGVSPVAAGAQPEAVQIQTTSSGAAATGQLPAIIANAATQAGAAVAITAVAIVSTAACTASVSGTGVRITAIAGTTGEVVYDVTAAGQTVRKRITYATVQAGGAGGTSQTLALTAQVGSATYAQNGGTFALAAPASGRIAANLTGTYKAASGSSIALQTKVQYRLGTGSWIDVAGSETTGSTSDTMDVSGGEQGAPLTYRQTAGGVASAGPYTLTGLTSGSSYEFRALARVASGTATTTESVGLRLYAEQAA